MEISIVTGTYQRLASLQQMVASVRSNLEGFASYEIVIVDGGSTDGTIQWCKDQRDIRIIEQGELLGAVSAFNAGAETAVGKYVILANDDITFLEDSILHAYSWMEDNPRSGMGCFFQDRDGLPWHVSSMRAVARGKTASVHYGQVCIVPKQIGDQLGWWGDYLHTYGGDNELSCRVWEAGYTVDAIECACISDGKLDDWLRQKNAAPALSTGKHPDTMKWLAKWPNGPTVPNEHIMRGDVKQMRIMYLPLFELGNRTQKVTKVGLRNALDKMGTVLQVDYINTPIEYIFDKAAAFKPDIFIFQLQDASSGFGEQTIVQLRNQHPMATFVNWNGDYHPENIFNKRYMSMLSWFDLPTFVTTCMTEQYDAAGINHWYWQIGYEESSAKPDDNTPQYDILFLGNEYIPQRTVLGTFLKSLEVKGWAVGIYGSWRSFRPSGTNLYDFDAGQKLYQNATFAISSQEYPEAYGFVSNRMFQALAAGGCLVLQQKFDGMEELLGLQDKKHLVVWETHKQLESLLEYYNKNERERMKISKAGTAYIRKNCSFDAQVKKLFKKLEQDKQL